VQSVNSPVKSHTRHLTLVFLSAWVFVVLGDSYDLDTHSWNPDGLRILRQQDLWFVFGMTVFTMIPWFTVREVKVEIEIPSPKVAILRFERGMQQGLLARISRGSVMEYHAFGIISEGKKSGCHYLICGVQGDFTKRLVQDPPTHIWTRELKFAGVSNTSTLYRRGVRICTGTGLGTALATCIQNPDWYLIWIGSDQEKTFGPTISSLIYDKIEPERRLLWDSKARGGRPDVMKLIKESYVHWNAEVVIITSNFQGNKDMMEGCKAAGIPAFVSPSLQILAITLNNHDHRVRSMISRNQAGTQEGRNNNIPYCQHRLLANRPGKMTSVSFSLWVRFYEYLFAIPLQL
jgi:hypothetical protein